MTTSTTAEVRDASKHEQIMSCSASPRRAVFMRFKQLAIVTVFVGGAAMGYGGEYDASSAEQALSPDLHDLRRAFRHATAIYHDTDRLERILLPGRGLPDAADAFQPDVPVRGGYEWLRLHVWAWLSNPNGLTDPANPNVDTTYCP